MVDIAASLSLTPSSPSLDPAAILGAETADNQAFGDILAGQIAGQPTSRPTAAPFDLQLPTLPLPAGNRQPGGNILPGAAQILPDATTIDLDAMQVSPDFTAAPAKPLPPQAAPAAAIASGKPILATLAGRLAAPLLQGTEIVLPEAQTAEAAPQLAASNPVHALLKMVAAAIRTPRQTADEAPVLSAEQEAAPETDSADQALPSLATVAIALPVLPILVVPTLQSVVPAGNGAEAPQAPPVQASIAHPAKSAAHLTATAALLPAALPQVAEVASRDQAQPSQQQANQNQPAATPSIAPQAVAAAKPETPSVPVLTVAAVPAEAAKAAVVPAPAVTLAPAQPRPAGTVTTARIKVASAEPTQGQTLAADRITASLTPAADRAGPAAFGVDRILPTAMPIVTDGQQVPTTAPAAPVTTAPVVEMPRQDFAALVERLVEARNAAAPASTHASINHAEFGQVSLHFQQDGGDLKVGMSSADPGFAVAVQAAMPAERQNMNADTQQRGQSSNQSSGQNQSQSASTSSNSNHETAGQRGTDTADQQGGRGQGRNSRGGTNNSNPSQRWTGEQPQSRGGIFA